MPRSRLLIALALCSALGVSVTALGAPLQAQPAPGPGGPPAVAVDAVQKREVIAALDRQLRAYYAFPDVASKVAAQLIAKEKAGGYAAATDSKSFAKALTEDLHALGRARQKLQQDAAGTPVMLRAAFGRAQFLGDREPHPGRDLFGA